MTPELPENGLTLILGGARSGKSSFAEQAARQSNKPVLFIATATAGDDEMAERIRNHRAARPAEWKTLECPRGVATRLGESIEPVVILDCLTLLVTNVLLALPEDAPASQVQEQVAQEIESLLLAQSRLGGQWLVVSNEVGLGLVPPYPLGRVYRDVLGWANQRVARAAQRVLFMVAGLPMVVK